MQCNKLVQCNKLMQFDKLMDLLPDELLRLIFDFVPNECKIKLNTKYYTKYHHLIIVHLGGILVPHQQWLLV